MFVSSYVNPISVVVKKNPGLNNQTRLTTHKVGKFIPIKYTHKERHRISCDIYAHHPYNFHDIKQYYSVLLPFLCCTKSISAYFVFFFFCKYLHADTIKTLLGIKPGEKKC